MSISACSVLSKMVNFGAVFFGFSLHHLFMHLNGFHHSPALHGFGALQTVIFGFSSALVPPGWVVGRGEGAL